MAKKEVDDRFKKFGTVSFTAISKTNDFIDYLEEGRVMGTRCKIAELGSFLHARTAPPACRATWSGLRFPGPEGS
jgi:hypothetical protein